MPKTIHQGAEEFEQQLKNGTSTAKAGLNASTYGTTEVVP
jgi:hypothetical protein